MAFQAGGPIEGSLTIATERIPEDEGFNVSRNTVWRRFRRHKVALAGGIVIVLMAFFAAFGHLIYQVDPNAIDQVNWTGYPLAPGVAGHPLGTDENGRDLLARLIAGGQVSLTVALFAVLMQVVIGSILGALSGYYGGWVDFVIMRFTDVVLSIPLLPLLLVLTAIVSATSNKASLSFGVIVILIGGLTWPAAARLVRASFLSLREREFAEAARAIGGNDARIIFRHLLPNAIAPIIVQATLAVAGVILTESVLSFLGFGIQPPQASWGNMLANAQSMITIAPGVAIFPGLCILIVSLSINYLGDGLRDALDPNQR
jgi:peptide/nickel transport system permease protein